MTAAPGGVEVLPFEADRGGAAVCTADWRAATLLASRSWPRRSFRPAAIHLARHVDPRIAWPDGRG